MAMTKKEREEREALEQAVKSARALGWVSYSPNPEKQWPKGNEVVVGYLARFQSYGGISTQYAASTTSQHCQSSDAEEVARWAKGGRSFGSREAIGVYRKRSDALKALRLDYQVAVAKELASIDAAIERAIEDETPK